MYVTSVLQKTDMKAVALQMALDMLHEKEQRDLITGLKSRYIDYHWIKGDFIYSIDLIQNECWETKLE